MSTPLSVTFYNEANEPTATYGTLAVPWRLVKAALVAQERIIEGKLLAEEHLSAVKLLVVQAFDHQFTLAQLEAGLDVEELMVVVVQITARFDPSIGLLPDEIDWLLVRTFGWPLPVIGDTDVDALFMLLRKLCEDTAPVRPAAQGEAEPASFPQRQPGQLFADEVTFL